MATKAGYKVERDLDDPDKLRSLSSDTCYFVTQQRLMRAFDYRGEPLAAGASTTAAEVARVECSLLIAKSSPTTRDYVQALGRVGRYNDPCRRYRIQSVEAVDESQESAASSLLAKR